MDRRTVYLQELIQVSDMLQAQRNAVRGLGALAMGIFGTPTVAATIPPNTLPTWGTNLRVSVPAIMIYQLGQVDPRSWPDPTGAGTPIAILSADPTQLMMQGLNVGATVVALTGTPDVALSIGVGNSIYYLIEGQISTTSGAPQPIDQNNQVLPYQSLLQTIISSATSSTVINVGSTVGMSQGDRIAIPGFTFGGNQTSLITTINSATQLTLTTALDSTTNIGGAVLRDLNPAAGSPLNGPGNTGIAQPTDRVWAVTLQVKAGTAGATPAKPSADAGFIPLWLVGPLANGFLSSSGSASIAVATDQITGLQTAPFLPGYALNTAHHHKGLPGQAAQIDLASEASYVPVNRIGDNMTGALTFLAPGTIGVPGDSGTVPPTPGLGFTSFVTTDPTITANISGLRLSHSGWIDAISTLGLRWNPPNASYAPFPFTRFTTSTATHTNTLTESVTVGFAPSLVILLSEGAPGSGFYFVFGSGGNSIVRIISSTSGSDVYATADQPGAILTTTGFRFGGGEITGTFRWFALG